MDATFKSYPNGYYQLFNILIFHEETNNYIPCFHILMSNKTEESYSKLFFDIVDILEDYDLTLNLEDVKIMCDFERGLRKAITNVFEAATLEGCYFHYVKALWEKAKKLGLTRKKRIARTKVIIFCLKCLPLSK